jgi:hypothetical protein
MRGWIIGGLKDRGLCYAFIPDYLRGAPRGSCIYAKTILPLFADRIAIHLKMTHRGIFLGSEAIL